MIIKDENQGFFFAVITTDGEDVTLKHLIQIFAKFQINHIYDEDFCIVESANYVYDLFLQKLTINEEEKQHKYYLPIKKFFTFQGKIMNADEIAKI